MGGRRSGSSAVTQPEWSKLRHQNDAEHHNVGDWIAQVRAGDDLRVFHGTPKHSTLQGRDPLVSVNPKPFSLSDFTTWTTDNRDVACAVYTANEGRVAEFRIPPGNYAVFDPYGLERDDQFKRATQVRMPNLIGRVRYREIRKAPPGWQRERLMKQYTWQDPHYRAALRRWYLAQGVQGFVLRDTKLDLNYSAVQKHTVWGLFHQGLWEPVKPWANCGPGRLR